MKPYHSYSFYISDKHQTHNVFILASTTEDGDAPFHAENFKQTLENHRNVDVFKGLNFAVFALGSSMYENYWAQIAILNLCSINNIAASNGMESSWPYVTKSSTRELYLHLSGNGGKYVIKVI